MSIHFIQLSAVTEDFLTLLLFDYFEQSMITDSKSIVFVQITMNVPSD